MSLLIRYSPYRLLFKHPFGTAHGLRDGTDSLFIALEEHGTVGYGEVTLPPYLSETIPEAIERLRSVASRGPWTGEALFTALEELPDFASGGPGARAGLSMALMDLLAKQQGRSVREFLGAPGEGTPITLVTLGITPIDRLSVKLAELPQSTGLKVKVGDNEAIIRTQRINQLDNRRLLIDGNQGIRSVEEAINLVRATTVGRLICMEQPFATDVDQWNAELRQLAGVRVFADESIQGMADLDAKHGLFDGVNIKLMKCGGLDRAKALAERAASHGLGVMLGSMSESSLGCAAMAQLGGMAEIVDLDGPWLIKNDPFEGLWMDGGNLRLSAGPGLGVSSRSSFQPEFIGA